MNNPQPNWTVFADFTSHPHSIAHRDIKLDVLRAIAVISVFLYHCMPFVYGKHPLQWDGIWPKLTSSNDILLLALSPFNLGWLGVSLFLVISGFCIHHSFLNSSAFSIRRFFWRRFWRIYPPYLAALVCISAWEHINPLSKEGAFQFLSHALLVHNLHPNSYFAINPSFWSLALEAQCYALFPLLLFIRARTNIKTVLWATFSLALAARIGILLLSHWHGGEFSSRIKAFPLFLWFDWALGAYVAECYHHHQRAFRIGNILIAGILIVFLLTCIYTPLGVLTFPTASFLFAAFMDRYLRIPIRPTRVALVLAPIGLCSYSFYLWHQPLIAVIFEALRSLGVSGDPITSLLSIPVAFAMIFGFSWGLYFTVERSSVRIGNLLSKRYIGAEH